MRRSGRHIYDELARVILPNERAATRMIGSTTAGGVDEETEVDGLPMPLGSVGDVLTVVTDGTDTTAAWATPTPYTNEQAQDAVGGILTDTASIDLTYDDGANTITAAVILEWLQDTVAAILTGGSHTNITTTYQDATGVIDLAATGGGGGAPTTAKYIVQEVDAGLSAEQSLGALTTGLLKNTVTGSVGVLSTATAADLPSGIDAAKIGGGGVSTAEFDFLGSVTSNVQTQLDGKQPLDADLTTIAGLVDPNADRILFWDDSAGTYAYLTPGTNLTITGTTIDASGSGGTITVQEGDSTVDASVTTLDFDASDFNVTSSPAGEANIALAYGTGAGTPAEGNHDHTGVYQPLDATLTDLAALADPNADRMVFWDDSAGAHAYLAAGSGLSISGTTMTADTAGIGNMVAPRWVTGRYYDTASQHGSAISLGNLTINVLTAVLIYVPNSNTVDRIAFAVTTQSAGNLARLGIYNMGSDGNPGSLLLDAGTISLTGTGLKEITISQALDGGNWYWLAIVANGAAAVRRLVPNSAPIGYATLDVNNNLSIGVEKAHAFAALPNPFGTPTITTGFVPRIGVRAG